MADEPRGYDPEDFAAIAAYTRDQLIDIQIENELELRREYDYDYTKELITGGLAGTNFMTTRELRDNEYDSFGVPEEDRKYQPGDTLPLIDAMNVAQIVRALMALVNERPELANVVPLMWHELDSDVSIGARITKVVSESYDRIKLVGPKGEPKPEPKKEEISLRCRHWNVAPKGIGYVARQCVKTVGHGARHSFEDVALFYTIDEAKKWRPL